MTPLDARLEVLGGVLLGFGAEDVIHLTELDPATAAVQLRGERLVLFSDVDRVGVIDLPGIAPGTGFTLTADGSGGTLLALDAALI